MTLFDRWKTFFKENLYCVIVLVCVLTVLSGFACRKEGFHLDEILSYDLANAEYSPFILPAQPVGRLAKYVEEEIRGDSFWETCTNLADTVRDLVINRGESRIVNYKADVYPHAVWITGGQFRDYLTVTDEDAFNYLSVYFNARTDIHPPLYYMLLHTVSSVLRGDASRLAGGIANILVIMGSCILLMKLGMLLERKAVVPEGMGKILGISAALLYGISRGGTVSMLLARMYALLGFFMVLTFYLHVKKWLGEGFAAGNGLLTAATAAGFLTQYFFVLYCIPLACVTSALLLARKRYRELWRYVRSMIISAVLGLALFPFALDDVFSSGFGQSVAVSMKDALGEYGERLQVFGRLLLEGFYGKNALAVPALLAVICLVLAVVRRRSRSRVQTEAERNAEADRRVLWLMFLVPFAGFFFLSSEACPYWELRYMMPLFPFLAILTALASVRAVSGFWGICRYLALVPALLLALVNAAAYDGALLYEGYGRQLEIAEEYAGLPCVCVCERDNFYYNIWEFMEYERTLITSPGELEEVHDLSALEEKKMIVIRKYEMDEEETLRILDGYGWELEETLLREEDSVYRDTVYLYGRKK